MVVSEAAKSMAKMMQNPKEKYYFSISKSSMLESKHAINAKLDGEADGDSIEAAPSVPETNCGCNQCDAASMDKMLIGSDGSRGTQWERIWYLHTIQSQDYEDACFQVCDEEFRRECNPECDPMICNEPPAPGPGPAKQRCGGAVDKSSNWMQSCHDNLWDPTGDATMHCYAYGGPGDPCAVHNNNDVDSGVNKNPSHCDGDTFYLWDEPDTQHKTYNWAGAAWLAYSRQFAEELRSMRSSGTKVTGPLLRAGDSGVFVSNMQEFFDACGPACVDPSDPAYIDVIAVNAFCGPWNDKDGGCRAGAAFIYKEAKSVSKAFNNLPVYVTNWARLQSSNPSDQIDAIQSIDEFFPPSGGVIERVYWFGALDYGGGADTTGYLTNVLQDGQTLGELWEKKCNEI